MKTSLDFDIDEYKFQQKLSILELVFSETKQAIGYTEFDLGAYTNKIRGSTVKTILDLKSDKFPGCQIYIYVNIQLLDALPEKPGQGSATTGGTAGKGGPRESVALDSNASTAIDLNENMFKIKEQELKEQIKTLEDSKIKLEQENERLKFQKDQADTELCQNTMELLKAKTETKNGILKKIDKYAKQEAIILKVLDIINNSENEGIFGQPDDEINAEFEDIKN